MLWSVLTSDYLDLRFAPSRDLSVRIVECPGRWMPAGQLSHLLDDCRTVAAACLNGASLEYGILAPDSDATHRTIITLIRNGQGEPIAFNALPLLNVSLGGEKTDVIHLGLVMVDPSVRSSGLSWILYGLTCLLLFVRRQLRPLWVSSVTQVPAVVGMVSETFDSVWPGPSESTATFAHRYIGRQIMHSYRAAFGVGEEAGYDDARGIITNAYTGGSDNLKKTFEVAAKHRHEEFNTFCLKELDYDRGDDVLQIGQINLASAQKFLLKSTPRWALPQLAIQVLVLGVQSLIAPLAQWLNGRRSLARLRPSA